MTTDTEFPAPEHQGECKNADQSPRAPGPGAILLATAGFLFAQFFLLAAGMLVLGMFPRIPFQFVNLLVMFFSTLLWGLGAWLWIQVRHLPSEWISLAPPKVRGWFWPVLLLMVPTALSFGGSLDMLVSTLFSLKPQADPTLERLSETAMDSATFSAMVMVLAVVAAPVCEELFFRGVALRSLRFRNWSFAAASLFTSLLFAGIHFKLTGFFLLFILAVLLSMLAERTRSLLPSMVFHAAHNTFVVFVSMLELAKKPVFQAFSMNPPTPPKTPVLPNAAAVLVHFVSSIPWFFVFVVLLYFGAVPKLEPKSEKT